MRIDSPLLLLINNVIVVVVDVDDIDRGETIRSVAILNKINMIQIRSKSRSSKGTQNALLKIVATTTISQSCLSPFCHGIHHPKVCVFLLKDKNFINST
jgi:hypothetical protein